jgi:hypothetical protein
MHSFENQLNCCEVRNSYDDNKSEVTKYVEQTATSKTGQLKTTGGPHNSLRTYLRAALMYTNIERGWGEED